MSSPRSNDNPAFRDGIAAVINALVHLMDAIQQDINVAQQAIRAGSQNAAVGALSGLDDRLQRALGLYNAIIAMHLSAGRKS